MNRLSLIGKKIGMTSLFIDNVMTPVTIVKAQDNYFLGTKTYDQKQSIVITAFPVKEKKQKKSAAGLFKKNETPYCSEIKEFEIDGNKESLEKIKVGTKFEITDEMVGTTIDVRSVSKGKGFQGVMKRWNFAGLPASHGVSVSHRSLGSTGQRTLPGKVWKGKKMPGQMGSKNSCVKNLKILKVDKTDGLIFIKGSIPGGENSVVYITDAINLRGGKTFDVSINMQSN